MELQLHDSNITDNDIGRILELLNQNPNIKKLYLSTNEISDRGAHALSKNTTLTELDLSINRITDSGALALASNNTLKQLILGDNDIGDSGAQALARNTPLTVLDLSMNRISDSGAIALAENRSLKQLKLVSNDIGDTGAQALAKNSTISELDLEDNNVGDSGASALAHNSTIRILNLNYNNIGNRGAEAFLHNTTLVKLDIYNDIDYNLLQDISQHIQNNIIRKKEATITGKKKLQKMQRVNEASRAFYSNLDYGRPGTMTWAQEMGVTSSMTGGKQFSDIGKLKSKARECRSATYLKHYPDTDAWVEEPYSRTQLYHMARGLGLTPGENRTKNELCLLLSFHGGSLDCSNLKGYTINQLQIIAEGYNNKDIYNYNKEELCRLIKSKL